jgi:type VI secretion system protein ImpJ
VGYEDQVLWNEGMFLAPHHFQQADRHRDFVLRRRIANLSRFDWGLGVLDVNHEALSGGDVRISQCQAVMSDGLVIDIPDHDEAPQSRNVGEFFSAQTTRLGVFLAVPVRVPGKAVARIDDVRSARYRGEYVSVADENADGRDREVLVARKNLKLLFEGEPLDGYDTIQIFNVIRDGSGKFQLDDTFLPTAYALRASENMVPMIERLMTNLSSRRESLNAKRRGSGSIAKFAASDAISFWLLHTINLHWPVLGHFVEHPEIHPEQLYLELVRLAGGLATFSPEFSFNELAYKHEKQTMVFGRLESELRQLLDTVIPQRSKVIVLRQVSESMFAGPIEDDVDLAAEFYLAVRSDVGEDKLINELPIKAKISTEDRLPQLIAAAVRGIPIRHVPNPPTEIFEPGWTYFQFDKTGDHWESVCQEPTVAGRERTVAVYLPPEFTGARVQLMAVTE